MDTYAGSLRNALDEVAKIVRSYKKDPNQKVDQNVHVLLDSCERAIFDIRISCGERLSSYQSESDYNKIINAPVWSSVELPEYDEPKMKDAHYKKHECLEATFPEWNTSFLDRILSTDMKAAMSLLPYILTAYYFDMIDSIEVFPASSEKIIFDPVGNSDQNYNQSIRSLCQKLSLEHYIETQCSTRHRHYLPSRIGNRQEYISLISDASRRFLQNYHAAKIIQAFIYSLFAHLCTLSPEIDKLVDYKLSFRLFNEHTCAFHSRYIAEGSISGDMQVDTGKLFDDDAELVDRVARVIAISQDIQFAKGGNHFFLQNDYSCFESCGLDQLQSFSLKDGFSDPEMEKMLYRILPGIYMVWLHPVFGQMFSWPTLFHAHYRSGFWETPKKKAQDEFPDRSVMPWDSVKPFFDRRLS